MEVSFYGVRGSVATSDPRQVRYGGHTACVGLGPAGGLPNLLLDAGTGLLVLDDRLAGRPFEGSILLGHLHWDHWQGMPFFAAGARPGHRVEVHLPAQPDGASAVEVLSRSMSPPHFPIAPAQLGPGWRFDSIEEGRCSIEGYEVLARELPHKGGRTFGYKVSDSAGSVAYLSDHCPLALGPGPDGTGEYHEAALALADGVDLLVHDAQFLASEFPGVTYLGHAAAEYAVELGRRASAGRVVLFHHSPRRDDDAIDEIVAGLDTPELPVVGAREGLVLRTGPEG